VSATKSVLPADATGWSVDFTISPVPAGGEATKAATADEPTVTWEGLLPGTAYSVTEGAMPGFVPGTVSCDEGASTFTPQPGDEVSCVVTNTQLASVSATKSVLPADATGWSVDFTISPVPAGAEATKAATADEPTVTWEGLLPGTAYTVTEGAMPGFVPGTVGCAAGSNTFTPTPGQAVSCAVTNAKFASVTATKSVLPAATAGWAVDFTISPVPSGQFGTKTATGTAPTVTWEGLLPGTQYTITEGTMPGFTSGLVTCGAGSNAFVPLAGEVVSCAVTNTAIGVVEPEEEVDETEDVAGTEDEIAATGANSVPLAAAGIWLALIGASLVVIASRRRRA